LIKQVGITKVYDLDGIGRDNQNNILRMLIEALKLPLFNLGPAQVRLESAPDGSSPKP